MTMYVVYGEGEMPAADLKASLDDLEAKAVEASATFWMLVRATSEPNATDRALMTWLNSHECYFETVGPEANSADPLYKGTQEKHTVKGVAAKIVQLMQEKPEEGETAHLLALYASDDPDATEDAELNGVVEAVLSAGFEVLAFNDGLAAITLTEAAVEEDAEPEPEAAAEEPSDDDAWCTQENLEKLSNDEIKVIAARFGIELPPRTRMPTYINAILNRDKGDTTPEAEVESVGDIQEEEIEASTANGQGSNYSFDVVKSVLRSLGEALIAASK
jgi:hypothetical protein